MKIIRALAIAVMLSTVLAIVSCEDKSSVMSPSCTNGPYTFDANPDVQRCRASNGQFAANICCGR